MRRRIFVLSDDLRNTDETCNCIEALNTIIAEQHSRNDRFTNDCNVAFDGPTDTGGTIWDPCRK